MHRPYHTPSHAHSCPCVRPGYAPLGSAPCVDINECSNNTIAMVDCDGHTYTNQQVSALVDVLCALHTHTHTHTHMHYHSLSFSLSHAPTHIVEESTRGTSDVKLMFSNFCFFHHTPSQCFTLLQAIYGVNPNQPTTVSVATDNRACEYSCMCVCVCVCVYACPMFAKVYACDL